MHAGAFDVGGVPGDERQVVRDRRGGEQAVDDRERVGKVVCLFGPPG